ncbi:MAG TPA: FAD:protein FMN transferase [Candidatus Limnocylindrales bacterium]|nr:FAD:protein FMN transferase [Candidatus Limnocylindrales bacterium]
MIATAGFPALGTGVRVLTASEGALAPAVAAVQRELQAIDETCSRFRSDSELAVLNRGSGAPTQVSPLLFAALEAAVRACRMTDGAVDPTMGRGIRLLGYDRDFADLRDGGPVGIIVQPAGGVGVIEMDRRTLTVRIRGGHEIDLGAIAKGLAADRAATAAHAAIREHASFPLEGTPGEGVLVSLGGDLAIAGEAPQDGWPILVTDDHAAPLDGPGQVITLRSGALATSSTTVRRWRQGGVERHHILDPRTGLPAAEYWRTASVVAATCVDANTAATASIVWGEHAISWLREHHLPARLVRLDGAVTYVNGWPVAETVAA